MRVFSMWSVAGHDSVVHALARGLAQGRMSHAYLFIGPRGVGKFHLAMNLAQALNCAAPPSLLGPAPERPCGAPDRPCNDCAQCRRIAAGKHADFGVIALPSGGEVTVRKTIDIDDIRDMLHAAQVQPVEGKYKVFVVDGVEHLSLAASNTLLKNLEEPAAAMCWILLAVDERAVLPTVLSRCQTYRLRPVPKERIAELLSVRQGIEQEKALLLAAFADGCPGWAVNAARDEAVAEARAAQMDRIVELPGMPYHERLVTAGKLAEDFSRGRDALYGWLVLFRQYWRDVLLVQGGQREAVVNSDRLEALEAVAAAVAVTETAAVLRRAQATTEYLERNANARLALDVLMLNLPVAKRQPAGTMGAAAAGRTGS